MNRSQSGNQVTTRSKSKMFKKREFDMDDDIDTAKKKSCLIDVILDSK